MAAIKNKMRRVEKAFINLMQVKNIPWAGFTVKILLILFMGQRQFFNIDLLHCKFHNNFI
jgi:hypothetical protein